MNARLSETKKWLNRGRVLDNELKTLWERIEEVKAMCEGGAINYSTDGTGLKERENSVLDRLILKADLLHEYGQKYNLYLTVKEEIFCALKKIEDETLRHLVLKRYYVLEPWKRVADLLGKDLYYVQKELHYNALLRIEEIINASIPR